MKKTIPSLILIGLLALSGCGTSSVDQSTPSALYQSIIEKVNDGKTNDIAQYRLANKAWAKDSLDNAIDPTTCQDSSNCKPFVLPKRCPSKEEQKKAFENIGNQIGFGAIDEVDDNGNMATVWIRQGDDLLCKIDFAKVGDKWFVNQ
ncbi:hypothetical protein [Actinomyces vulturis]|uniref:hypothetical protein n=1 Tax=Actinomyces vulturis TaxID=1857645 RepID=UPI0008366B1B|nr:hypothetical protein [Actinomyces vulturis]